MEPKPATIGESIPLQRLPASEAASEAAAGRWQVFAGIAAGLAAAIDPREVAEAIVTRLGPALGARSATVRILRSGVLELLGEEGYPPAFLARYRSVPLGAGLPVTDALEREEAIWLESPAEIAGRYPDLAALVTEDGQGAWVAAPLLARGRRLGALGLIFPRPRRFDLEDRAFVLAIAEQCALALDRALLFEAERDQRSNAQHAAGRVRRLQAVTAALSAARTVDDVGSVFALQAHEALGVEVAAAYVLEPGGAALRSIALLGLTDETRARFGVVPLDADLPLAEAARTGAAVWLSSQDELLARYPRLKDVPSSDLLSALASLPLRSGGVTRGAVTFGLRDGRRFAPEDRELLATVADQCAQALERAELFDAERGARDDAKRARGLLDAIVENAHVGVGVFDREAEEFQRHVLGVVGHDLRNPLSAIATAAQLLERSAPDGATAVRLGGRIRAAAKRMERIIDVLLDYTRARGGQPIPLRRRTIDVAELCRAAVDESVAAHGGREVRLRGEGSATVEWDPDRLAQVLSNLLGNAIEHGAPEAPVELVWRAGREEVELEVSNEGTPIPPDLLPRLFEPFRRAAGDGANGHDGLGLGLFIARAIVIAHGGTIEARSASERTCFTVRLPRRPA